MGVGGHVGQGEMLVPPYTGLGRKPAATVYE